MPTVNFDVDLLNDPVAVGTRYVECKAPVLFRTGDYPDKKFSLTPEELAETAKSFSPVHLDLEHRKTVFDGQLGYLGEFSVSANDPTIATGKAYIPEWVDKIVPKEKRKLSMQFDPDTKKVIGCSLVVTPRIADAAMFAAFTADLVDHNGAFAMPPPDAPPPPARTPDESLDGGAGHGKALAQPIYDMCMKACKEAEASPNVFDKKYCDKLRKMMGMAVDMGAHGEKVEPGSTAGGSTTAGPGFSEDPAITAMKKEYEDKLKKQADENAATQKKLIDTEAISFADNAINDRRAFPTEKPNLIEIYTNAAKADMVNFSTSGQPGNLVEALRKMVTSRPQHNYTREQLPDGGAAIIPAEFSNGSTPGANGKMSADRRKTLLGSTRVGQQILNAEKSTTNRN